MTVEDIKKEIERMQDVTKDIKVSVGNLRSDINKLEGAIKQDNDEFEARLAEAESRGAQKGYEKGFAEGRTRKELSDAQDEAYQRGYEAGLAEGRKQAEEHDGCMGCYYEPCGEDEEPCIICKGRYMDQYRRADDEIRVGDIVKIKETDIEIWVTGVFDDGESINGIAIYDCDDNCDAGDTYSSVKKRRLKKTGKHYPMEKLLEAMKE